MAETETPAEDEGEAGGTLYDAPNQQAVRPDGSAPWDEGDGGTGTAEPEPASSTSATKAELLEQAAAAGVAADSSMTKAEIQAAIDAGAAE